MPLDTWGDDVFDFLVNGSCFSAGTGKSAGIIFRQAGVIHCNLEGRRVLGSEIRNCANYEAQSVEYEEGSGYMQVQWCRRGDVRESI